MSIPVSCDGCFNSFSVKDEHAGKKVKCPECGDVVQVPARGGRSSGSSTRSAPAASRSSASRPSRARQEESKSNAGLLIGGAVVGVVLLLGIIGFFAFRAGQGGKPAVQPVAANTPANAAQPAPATPGTTPPATASPASVTPGTPAATIQPPPGTPAETIASKPIATPVPTTTPVAGNTPSTPAPATPAGSTPSGSTPAAEPSKTYASTADLIAAVEPSVCRINVSLQGGSSLGSGFVVDKEGIVVTNYHVIEGAQSATVHFADKTEGKVLGYLALSHKMDIAVLKIDYPSDKLHPVKMATKEPRKGEDVIAIGSPLGLEFTATEGKVSAFRDSDVLKQFGGDYEGTWIQMSTPISPGNSGGPLFNMQGEVVAANTLSISGSQAQNLNFGTSFQNIQKMIDKKSTTLTAMTPSAAPQVAARRPARQAGILDETKTLRGKQLLANVNEVLLFEIHVSDDNTGNITNYVKSAAERMWRSAGVEVTGKPDAQAFMVVVMELKKGAGSSSTASVLQVHTVLMVRDDKGNRCRVYDTTDDLGAVSQSALIKGNVPDRMKNKVTEFFTRLKTAREKAKAGDSKEEEKKPDEKDTKKK